MSSTVALAEISKNFGAYQDAATREPVIVTEDGRPRTVLVAYEHYVRLTMEHRHPASATELSEAEITAVERSQAR
jgi:prevent-host-death family protein